jgi:hypothetical protein
LLLSLNEYLRCAIDAHTYMPLACVHPVVTVAVNKSCSYSKLNYRARVLRSGLVGGVDGRFLKKLDGAACCWGARLQMSWAPSSRGLALWLRGLRGGSSVRTAFLTTKIAPAACHLPRPHDHDSTTREDLSAGAPGAQGPLEWGSWGFGAARGRCSGQLRSK